MEQSYKCYLANKRLNPQANFPLIIVVAQKDEGAAFSEHYIFTGLDKPSMLLRWTGYQMGRLERRDFDEFIKLDDLIISELERAKANLEFTLYNNDKALYEKLYWEGHPFDFKTIEDQGLLPYFVSQKYKGDFGRMFEKTQSQALAEVEKLAKIYARMVIKEAD